MTFTFKLHLYKGSALQIAGPRVMFNSYCIQTHIGTWTTRVVGEYNTLDNMCRYVR